MKAKSGKIIKICALSLGLLMLGGATITPITKVYADESGQSASEEMDRTIRIKYTGDKKFNGAWLWVVGQSGHFVPFKIDDSGNRYIDTTIKCKDGAKIGYIICRSEYDKTANKWSDPIEKDETVKNGTGIDANDRTIVVKGKGIEFSLTENDATEPKVTEIQSTTAEKVGNKLKDYVKKLKFWYKDEIDWEKAIDKSDIENIQDKDVKEALNNIKDVKDASARNNTTTSKQEGDIEVTFNDKSSLKFKNTLFITDPVTAISNKNAPEDAIDIELKLGDGVEDKAANKTGPTLYNKYKAKPGIDVSKAQIAGAGTLFDSNVKPTDLKQKLKWLNKERQENYIVSKDNNIFTATAIDQTIIRIYYSRPDNVMKDWKVMIYYGNNHVYSQPFDKKDEKGNFYAEVSLDGKLDSVYYVVYKDNSNEVETNGAKDKDGKRTLTITNGKGEARVEAKKEEDKKPQKPATPDSPKKPLVPSVRPSYSKSLDYKIVPEKKTEKKVKPSEKVIKSYKNLRVSREKNVVVVKAAKLLLEIAPERVKDVETNLINLIAKSEGLVKQADTILEKLEAKYEF